jgi:hypothetical protein
MPPPLPYFKVNICPFPLPHFRFINCHLFVIFLLTQLYRYIPEIFLFSTATFKYTYLPQTNWTRIFSKSRFVYFSVIFLMESALTSHGSSKSNKKPSDGRGISD